MDNKILTFKQFFKKNWIVFLCLGILPIIALIIFSCLMAYKICDISDLGSMLGGFLAYCGTILLGAVTVWQVERQRQENFLILEEQNYLTNKGTLQFYIEVIHNNVVFVVKNFGKSEIHNGSITFDKEWFDELGTYGDVAEHVKHLLEKSLSQNITLAPNQEIRFLLHFVASNNNYYNFLITKNCKGKMSYDTLGKTVNNEFDYSFHAVLTSYYGLTSDEEQLSSYERMHKEQISKLKEIDKSLEGIGKTLSNLTNKFK